MRKKGIAIGCGLAIMCATGVVLPADIKWWWFAASTLGGCLLAGSMAINRYLKREFACKSPFDDERRNFDALILGSTLAWKGLSEERYNNEKANRVVSYSFFRRSLFAASFILKRVYGLLRGGGIVILIYSYDELEESALSSADLALLHPVTLREIGIGQKKIGFKKSYPLFGDARYSAGYLAERLRVGRQSDRRKNESRGVRRSLTASSVEKSLPLLREIGGFCAEKGLGCHLLLIGSEGANIDTRTTRLKTCDFGGMITVTECGDITECNDFLGRRLQGFSPSGVST